MPRSHTFKGLSDWIEVFRAGTQTDSKGRRLTFTHTDLDQMAANVAALGAVPSVIGHPKDDGPAYAWTPEVRRDGDVLLAKFSDINPEFEAGVESGAYRNRSVAVFKDKDHGWRLRHIGWLGAALPAVPGLKPLTFSAGPLPAEADAFEFSIGDDGCMAVSYALDQVATLMRGVRDWVISTSGLETADRVLPDWAITSISNTAASLREQPDDDARPSFTHHTSGAEVPGFTQQDIDRARRDAQDEERQRHEAQFTAQQQQLAELQAERQTERIGAQIAAWRAAGLVLPAEEPGLAQFMAAMESRTDASFTFSRAEGETEEATPAAWFSAFIASRKPLVQLGQQRAGTDTDPGQAGGASGVVAFSAQPGYAGVEVDPGRAALDVRIKQYQREHGGDYVTAAAAVASAR
ncbi:hypothetical protein CKO44_07745 [Rubrivivax gelatinosus]|uniref:hypothetical protein n=1 Tax=Rubrivivax gelatinosus TaxID=28068 RepID=UPI0019050034|nr:hypothetical protein [Rubrivivax gelatinosus]MBK1613361.1 hypothetical protein [Rubrivivax gelatinosus]